MGNVVVANLPYKGTNRGRSGVALCSYSQNLIPLFPSTGLPPAAVVPDTVTRPLFPSSKRRFIPIGASVS